MEGPDSNTDEQRHGVQRSGRTLDPVLASRRGHTRSRVPSLVSCSGEKSSLMPAMLARPSMVSPAAVTTESMLSWLVMSAITIVISAPGNAEASSSRRCPDTSTAITRRPRGHSRSHSAADS